MLARIILNRPALFQEFFFTAEVEAAIGIEPMMKVLQTSALPLGYAAADTRPFCQKVGGAGNGIRTRDFDLGKVALYH